jgi:hypothetical protein
MTAALSTQHTSTDSTGSVAATAQPVRLPLGRLAATQVLSWAAGAAVVVLGAWLTKLIDPAAAALATAPALAGVLVSLTIIMLLGARTTFTWATVQVGTSALRLGVGVAGALVVYLMLREQTIGLEHFGGVVPGKTPYFMAFMIPAICTLIADSVVFRAALIAAMAQQQNQGTDAVTSSATMASAQTRADTGAEQDLPQESL